MRKDVRQQAAYGVWPSPVTAESAALHTRLEDVQWSPDGRALVWLEGRSGKGVLVVREGADAPRDLTETHWVRGGVGYGGGDFAAGSGFAVFAEKDGRLFRVDYAGGNPRAITPQFGAAASPAISPDGAWVAFVHTCGGEDCLAVVDSSGAQWPRKLASGADFYMQPVWHPDGRRLAWVEWDHPNMPWEGARLCVADVYGEQSQKTILAGGPQTPVFQPCFSPDGGSLAFLEGVGEWDALVVWRLADGKKRVLVEDASLIEPAWAQGMRVFGWTPDNQAIRYLVNDRGTVCLRQVDAGTGRSVPVDVGSYTLLEQVHWHPQTGAMACIASSPSVPSRVVVLEGGRIQVVARSCAERLEELWHPSPEPLTWSAEDGTTVHGLYYPPHNPDLRGTGLPPAIVDVHGGPTGQRFAAYSFDRVFFTSRGYAYLEVNYRGSSGYGRAYREALRGRWGETDVEDVFGGAKALCESGLADPARLVIKGGSAGGFTVYNALIQRPGFFRAGVCLYGVANLFTLAADTHKFEAHYLDSIVGTLPEAAALYRDRSPVFHADRIRDPLAIFQGAEDVVVPPSQSEEIVSALKAVGVPHLYRVFPGEGHGWRRAETLLAYYAELERFLRQQVVFS